MNNKPGTSIENGDVHFHLWAPKADQVKLVCGNKKIAMEKRPDGYFHLKLENIELPLDYFYELNEQKTLPDPCSRWQPYGVHRTSRIYDYHRFDWTDIGWNGIHLKDYIIYELHVGAFTHEGTFEGAIKKLPHLVDLGITAVELMPIAEFPGQRNWGYDQAYLYAPKSDYGGPEELKKFINAAHGHGLAVILDVVYNHFGPEGNYLDEYGYYFTDRYKTPWGAAINYDGPHSDHVRNFIIENALFWLEEFHIDALRLDAVHAIFDFGAKHILRELADRFHDKANELGRQAYLIAESDLNDVKIIEDVAKGGYGIDCQWNEDFHHALHALLTKSRWRYFADFGKFEDLEKAMREGFVYDWKYSKFRRKHFGSSSRHLEKTKFVVFSQNHDQIANACMGKRLGTIIGSEEQLKAATAVLLSDYIPLIFMGEEWNASSPFYYFTSFGDEKLAEAVRKGYSKEFDLSEEDEYDPQDIGRFEASKLDWNELKQEDHVSVYDQYKYLIALRKKLQNHETIGNLNGFLDLPNAFQKLDLG